MTDQSEKPIVTDPILNQSAADFGFLNMLFASKQRMHFYLVQAVTVLIIIASILLVIADKKQ